MSTLSEDYRKVLVATHKRKLEETNGRGWGNTSSGRFYKIILKLIDKCKLKNFMITDQCRQSKESLSKRPPKFNNSWFEPARPEVSSPPKPCNFVVCNDVFEHVEPEYLDRFFDDLQRVVADRHTLLCA